MNPDQRSRRRFLLQAAFSAAEKKRDADRQGSGGPDGILAASHATDPGEVDVLQRARACAALVNDTGVHGRGPETRMEAQSFLRKETIMSLTGTTASSTPQLTEGLGIRIPFDQINAPGTYVCDWSGHLLRVPEDAVKPGRSPVLEIQGKQPLYVTKISDAPFIALTKARMIACNLDLAVNF